MPIILQETLRAVFYVPFYAALALGAYEQEGVDVQFSSSPTPEQSWRRVISGDVDVAWGGPMRVMHAREGNPAADLVCFTEVVTRDPFFLVSRLPRSGFRVSDLMGLRLASVSEVPTPWLCLQEDIRCAGFDPGALKRISDRTMAENAEALRVGEVDVVQLFEPFVEALLEGGAGHLWWAAAERGATSYTCFYARRRTIEQRRDELMRMTRAIYRVQRWLGIAPVEAIVHAVKDFFPQVPEGRLAASVARYRSLEVWGSDPRLRKAGYDRLAAGLISGGFIRSAPPYEVAVDNSLADEVMQEVPLPLVIPR